MDKYTAAKTSKKYLTLGVIFKSKPHEVWGIFMLFIGDSFGMHLEVNGDNLELVLIFLSRGYAYKWRKGLKFTYWSSHFSLENCVLTIF